MHMTPLHAVRQVSRASAHREPARQRDSYRLADQQAERDAPGDWTPDRCCATAKFDPCVGEREDWHDHEGHDAMQCVLHALQWCLRRVGSILDVLHRRLMPLIGQHRGARLVSGAEVDEARLNLFEKLFFADACACRHGQGEQHASNSGVNTAGEYEEPEGDAEQRVREGMARAHEVQCNEGDEYRGGAAHCAPVERACVKKCDHQHCAQIVRNRECGKEDTQSARHAVAEQRQNAERERDIGGHRGAPTGRARPSGIEHGIQRRRDQHPAQCSSDGQGSGAPRGQFADEHFTLDLEPNEEEEDGHQAVVHPVMDRQRQREAWRADAEWCVPEMMVRFRPR